jgi:drug/metabolite transporter (DMT)-like permease
LSWFGLSLVCMLLCCFKTILAKRLLRTMEPVAFSLCDQLAIVVCLSPLIVRAPWSRLDADFWLFMLALILPSMLGVVALSQATKLGEMSEVSPLLIFLPVFVAVSGHVFFHEELSAWGWFGIALVGLGGYLLKLESFRRPWVPIIRFYTDPGARFVWVAIVLGVWTTHIQKLLVVSYDPFLTLFCNSLGICLCLIPSFLRRYPGIQSWRPLWAEQKTWLVLLGLVSSGSALSQFLAYSEGGNAAVVMSIKRLSVILISLYGMKILRESGGFAKAGGIFMMTLGGIYLYMS